MEFLTFEHLECSVDYHEQRETARIYKTDNKKWMDTNLQGLWHAKMACKIRNSYKIPWNRMNDTIGAPVVYNK